MSANSVLWPTLLDVAKGMDPNGAVADVAELLNQYNEILDDIPWIEGNLPTGNLTSVRKGIPTPTFRLANQGVNPVHSSKGQITDTCGSMSGYAEVDRRIAEMSGDVAKFRMSELKGWTEGFGQTLAKKLIYGDVTVSPEEFTGLAPRYYKTSTTSNPAGVNVLKGAGSGSVNTSIWLVGWGPETVHGIFPKGSKAGLFYDDKGIQTIYPASGGQFEGYRAYLEWNPGLAVKDWRYVVRICNIDVTNLKTASDATDTSDNILKLMNMALDQMFSLSGVRPVFYMNQTVRAMLRVKLQNKSNTWLTLENLQSGTGIQRPTLHFMGVPCRRVDQILNTEATIS